MKLFRPLSFLLCLWLTSSCIESTNPVSDPNQAPVEKKLIGLWKNQTGSEISYLHIGQPKGKLGEHFLFSMQVMHDTETGLGARAGEWRLFFSSLVGKHKFFNSVQMTPETIKAFEGNGWKPAPETKYDIFKYELTENTLKLSVPDGAVLQRAVEEKRVKGEVLKVGGVKLTDSSENLAKFLTTQKGLFPSAGKQIVFQKVR